ncbi:MAG: PqqD family peptide modification chaperone [Clostridia bacterium]|nr:PqqD family peptide modification chaperone [Clostridia bacterium]
MFNIDTSKAYQLNKELAGQFEPFCNNEGKLPSFSLCLRPLPKEGFRDLQPAKALGDYTFFAQTETGYWVRFCASYMCLAKDFRHADVYVAQNSRDNGTYEASNLLMQGYMYRLVQTGNFMIHSAAAVYGEDAILFCGLSGAGKSTQANLWKTYLHCDILNYDKPCIIREGTHIYAHGSPWSGKEALKRNVYKPLKAIVYVVQAKQNKVRMLSAGEAFSHIFLHNYVYPFTPAVESAYIEAIQALANQIPVYELQCDISKEAVRVLFETLYPTQDFQAATKEPTMKYKTKDCFMMKKIADEYIVIPRGSQAIEFNASVVFNESGAFLWGLLGDYTDEAALAKQLQEKYNIDAALAEKDTRAFLQKMDDNGLVDTIEE